jgi:hypothetical protein
LKLEVAGSLIVIKVGVKFGLGDKPTGLIVDRPKGASCDGGMVWDDQGLPSANSDASQFQMAAIGAVESKAKLPKDICNLFAR